VHLQDLLRQLHQLYLHRLRLLLQLHLLNLRDRSVLDFHYLKLMLLRLS
jgi:hypothetical protein